MFKIIVLISCFLTVWLTLIDGAPTDLPLLQNLPPKEGYIPVYIRIGDTPLNQINSGLARAFNETDLVQATTVTTTTQKLPDIADKNQDKHVKTE